MYKTRLAVIGILVSFLFVGRADAFTISPTRYLITAEPGTSQTVQLFVKNDEQESKKFKIFVAGLKQEKNGSLIFQKDSEVAETWVQNDQELVTLASGVEAKIDFAITVPTSAPPGSHYLGLAAETVSETTAGSALGGRLFSVLTLRVAGEAFESVSVESWFGPKITWKREWPMVLQLKNSSNIDVPIESEVSVNYLGKTIDKSAWSLGSILLVDSFRYLEKTLDPSLVWPGRYEVQNKISYGRSGQTVWALSYVWYFPIWSMVAGAVFFLFFLFVYIKIRYRHAEI